MLLSRGVSGVTCSVQVRYMFIWASLLSIQLTVVMNTISLTVLYRHGQRACTRCGDPTSLPSYL